MLSQLAAAQRQRYAGHSHSPVSSHAQFEPKTLRIQITALLEACTNVPLFPGETSAYKDLLTTLARVTLGELLCEVLLESNASQIGCSVEMFNAGRKYIAERNKIVNSRAAHSSSKGSAYGEAEGRNLRPNVTDFLRCGLTAMCKQADSWRDQAAFTNFVAVFVFSIVKGVDCECLDQLQLSTSELVSSKIKRGEIVGKAKTDEDGAAEAETHAPAEEADCEARASSGQKTKGVQQRVRKAAVKKDIKEVWPQDRRLFKDWKQPKLMKIVTDCLEIMVAGYFELLPSASYSEFEQTKLRASNIGPQESLMMCNIFKFVSQRLSEEREDGSGSSDRAWDAGNFWTDRKNESLVADFFSDSKPRSEWVEKQKEKCRRINVDSMRCGRALGFVTQNILHFLEKKVKVLPDKMTREGYSGDQISAAVEEATKHMDDVRRAMNPIVALVCSIPMSGNLGNRMSQLPNVKSKRGSKKGVSRCLNSRNAQTLTSSGTAGVAAVPSSVAGGAAEVIDDEKSRIRSQAQMIVKKPLSLPEARECGDFSRNICGEQEAGSFVVLVGRLCCAQEISSFSENVSSATLFAVFSSEETSLGKVPLVVFPCVGTEESDMVQYKLGAPVFFNQRRPCRESWAFVTAQAVKDHKRVNTDEGVFWFVDAVVKQQVDLVLQSDGMVAKWQECLRYERFFRMDNIGPAHNETVKETTWMIQAGPAGARADDFKKGFMEAQMLVQLAVAVNSEEVQLGTWPVEEKSGVLRDRFGDSRGKNLNSVLKSVEATEAPLSLCVELLNVPSLRTIMQSDSSERPSCVSVCTVVFDKCSRGMSDVQFYVPSWDSGFKCTVNGSFIVLILEKEDVEQKCNLLTLVPRIEARSEAMQKQMQCRSVIQGTLLAQYVPYLWEHMTSTSVSIRHFSSRKLPMAPSAFLDVFPWHVSTHYWSLEQELTSLKVPGDGDCWITSMLVSAGTLAWSEEAEGYPTNCGWVERNAPVINMVRRCVASVLFTIQEEYSLAYGTECDVAAFLFQDPGVQDRWRKIQNKEERFNPLMPGTYGGDPETAVLAWLIQVNCNFLNSKGMSGVDLNRPLVRALHFDRSAKPLLTLTGQMPQPLPSFRGEELPELRGFVDLKLDKSKAAPSFYEIFAFLFHPKHLDVPVENLSVVIAKQLLEAKFCETAEMSSVFIVHNGEADRRAHFDSIMSCHEKPLRLPPAQRLNVITHRLNVGATTFVGHLLEVALGIYLADEGCAPHHPLFAVHRCRDNDTVQDACNFFKTTYKIEVCADDIYSANVEALAPTPPCTRNIASGHPVNLPRKYNDRLKGGFNLLVPLRKDRFRCWSKETASMSSKVIQAKIKQASHTAMTMVCHQAGLVAKGTHHDARVHVFGYLELVQSHVGVVINLCAEEEAHSVKAAIAGNAMTQKLNEIGDEKCGKKALLLAYYTLQEPTTAHLVDLLCVSSTEALPFVRLCNSMRKVSKEFQKMTAPRHDLWLAAEHAQDVEKLKKTHPELQQPIKGMVVPASERECHGMGAARQIRERGFRLPNLFLFLSLIAGFGVYPLEELAVGCLLTEYGGVLVSKKEAVELERRGDSTHIRKIDRGHLALDGRPKAPCPMTYFASNHQVCFWNRVLMLVLKTPCENCLQFLLKQVGSILNDTRGTSRKVNCVYAECDNIAQGYQPPYQDGPKCTATMGKRVWIKTLEAFPIGTEATVSYGHDYWRLVDKKQVVCLFACM